MSKAKKTAKPKKVSVEAWGSFDEFSRIPYTVGIRPDDFSDWQKRCLAIRPITITYAKPPRNRT